MSTHHLGAAEVGFVDADDGTRIHWSAVGQGGPTLVCNDGIGCTLSMQAIYEDVELPLSEPREVD